MPPKPFGAGLALQIPSAKPASDDHHGAGNPGRQGDSVIPGKDGSIIMCSKSLTPYEFSTLGLIKATGVQHQQQQQYKVHKAYLGKESRFVAVKRIKILQREHRQQMLADIRALSESSTLACRGLIQFHGAYYKDDSNEVDIVLDYVDGGSLADLLQKVGRVPEPFLASMLRDVLTGLVALHQKHVVHRDIKPANILINSSGRAKITDFGISTSIDGTFGACQTYTGTLTYMSPERLEHNAYGYPADIWALGLALLEAVLGRYPYPTDGGPMDLLLRIMNDQPSFPPPGAISEPLRQLLQACLEKDPRRRPRAMQLLDHPWLAAAQSVGPAEQKAFMACMCDPEERLFESAFSFSWTYYSLLSQGPGGASQLFGLYTADTSVVQHEGQGAVGRDAIIALLQARVAGGGTWQLTERDVQPFGMMGDMLVMVAGAYLPPGADSPDWHPSRGFTETFLLSQQGPGNYYIANQVGRSSALPPKPPSKTPGPTAGGRHGG